jgi:Leucine-rich repeat (LRR) protein
MTDTPYQTALDRIHQAADSGAEFLDLSMLRLTSLPPEIGQLTNLKILDLYSNRLTSLPPEIGQIIGMTELMLFGNQLTSLPPEICQLTNLTNLNLGNNLLTKLPPEIGQLTNLRERFLSQFTASFNMRRMLAMYAIDSLEETVCSKSRDKRR